MHEAISYNSAASPCGLPFTKRVEIKPYSDKNLLHLSLHINDTAIRIAIVQSLVSGFVSAAELKRIAYAEYEHLSRFFSIKSPERKGAISLIRSFFPPFKLLVKGNRTPIPA